MWPGRPAGNRLAQNDKRGLPADEVDRPESTPPHPQGRKRSTGQKIDPLTETVDRPTSSTGRLALACFHRLPTQVDRPARGEEKGRQREAKVDRPARKEGRSTQKVSARPLRGRVSNAPVNGGEGLKNFQQIAATFRCGLTLSSS